MAMTQQQRDQAMKNIARMEQHYKILGRPNPNAQHMAMRKRSLQSGGNAVTNAGKGLLGGMGSDIGGMIGGLLGGRAKMVGDVVKGVGRDVGMGLGLLDPDQDFYDRTRETLRSQFGDERAEIYDRQMAARRAAAPSASSGSGSSMSTLLRPQMRRVSQGADLFDFPLMNMQRGMADYPDMSMPTNAAYLPMLTQFNQDPDRGVTAAETRPDVSAQGLMDQGVTYEDFLQAQGIALTPENIRNPKNIENYVMMMGE